MGPISIRWNPKAKYENPKIDYHEFMKQVEENKKLEDWWTRLFGF
jgi:hypothetical protein